MDTSTNQATSVAKIMSEIGIAARTAARTLAVAAADTKAGALRAAARLVRERATMILTANAADVAAARATGVAASFIDRLTLTPARIEAIAQSIEEIAALPDPIGAVTAEWTRPNGLRFQRVRTPLGVIGIIYESRPNVTADAGALALKAGNAAILRTGSDAHRSATAIHACLVDGLVEAGLPPAAIGLVPVTDRAAVGLLLSGLEGNVDVIVPRGGKSLVARVQAEARVPVFAHLEGICHTYVDGQADVAKAISIVLNAKLRRTSVCGATECVLLDRALAPEARAQILAALLDAGCEVRGDEACRAADARVRPAAESDFGTEFLDAIIAARVVDGVDAAIEHIGRYGSQHTDAIVTEDEATAARFMQRLDSAILLHNASTQFADGGEFGFGAEIGIATGRMHARGPVGVEQLTSFKYLVHGRGQTRPG
ncbi:MAG: glutamate-5-semialdehyde dehydrogenase [Hyphomicrobiales bacterium]|nr:glutamate-5-semialdehyde dehydrogenase [Hyphomicrobiales bacterium]